MEKIDGILPVDKSSGILSSSVVNKVKKVLKEEGVLTKVGHGGTLDKFASGLILILLGKATRLFEKIKILPKTYIATVKLGEFRSTDDVYGDVIQSYNVENITKSIVESTLKDFEGEILQVPPAFSSIHINGRRAYQIAKKDYFSALKSLKPRRVKVYKIQLIEFDSTRNEVEIFVECSGGTYIRSIARDLGQLLGTGAYLKSLRRESIGNISVEDAISDKSIMNISSINDNILGIEEFMSKNF